MQSTSRVEMKTHIRSRPSSTFSNSFTLASLIALAASSTTAFVVPTIELPPTAYTPSSTTVTDDVTSSDTVTAAPWRVSLNLGREGMTPLWDSYGASGIRFPVVVPCEFATNEETNENSVRPLSDTVSYIADINGGVTRPVVGGDWTVTSTDSPKEKLEFTLQFPKELAKKDVKIPGGSTLVLENTVHPQDELKRIEKDFSNARVEEWKAQEKIDEIQKIRDGPKRWNQETQRWERQKVDEPLTSLFSKQLDAYVKGQKRRQKFREKPRSGVELSDRPGRFPGFAKNNLVYFGTSGVIRNRSKGNMVVGTWNAEPITGEPASYLGN